MELTGLPLIVLVAGAAVASLAATVRLWSRGGRRRRLVTRTVGVLAVQVLLVGAVALVENRSQTFYPTWSDLAGGSAAPSAAPPPAGPLQPPATAPVEVPAGHHSWHLAAPVGLVTPAGYADRPGDVFPVIVALGTPGSDDAVRAAARDVPDAVTAIVDPTADTTPAMLTDLVTALRHDARIADHGWALATDERHGALAGRWRASDPRVTTPPVVVTGGDWAGALHRAADRLPPALARPLVP